MQTRGGASKVRRGWREQCHTANGGIGGRQVRWNGVGWLGLERGVSTSASQVMRNPKRLGAYDTTEG
jgi:hypothetical protein